MKLLVVDDEKLIREVICEYAVNDGFEVIEATDGEDAISKVSNNPDIDLIIMDIMMPKLDGCSACREIFKIKKYPTIMLSARKEEYDKLLGFDLGIDDYVTKPFRTPILLAKVNNILERRRQLQEESRAGLLAGETQDKDITAGTIRLVKKNMQCYINDEIIKITKTEYKLLEYLMENRGKNCTRESLFHTFWEGRDIDDRIIDTYIKKLRKLVANGQCEIVTAFGIGYRFEERK